MMRINQRIIIGIILVVFIVGIMYLYLSGNKSSRQLGKIVIRPTPTAIAVSQESSQRILSPVSVPPLWNSEQDTRYAVAYPPAWHTQPEPAIGRDVYMTFRPDTLASDEAFPLFIVQVYPPNKVTVQQRISELSYLDLQQKAVTFQGNQAIELSGIIPIPFETGNPLHKPVLKTYIIFQKATRVHMLDFTYFQDEYAEKNSELFKQMLGTLALPQ